MIKSKNDRKIENENTMLISVFQWVYGHCICWN